MNKTKQTITVNGRVYDAATGLAVENTSVSETPKQAHAAVKKQQAARSGGPNIDGVLPKKVAPKATDEANPHKHYEPSLERQPAPHHKNRPQKSKTLRRDILAKPKRTLPVQAEQRAPKKVVRSPHISRFAPTKHSAKHTPQAKEVDPELKQQAEELHKKHVAHLQKKHAPTAHISSKTIKEHLLKTQLDNAPEPDTLFPPEVEKALPRSRKVRLINIAATSLTLILLGGYLTYINIPNLSIRVAAANAGVDANLPRYQPNGYRIHGPIAYTNGEVQVNYQQNGGEKSYTITQRSTDWDPQATLDNYVQPDSQDDYQIHSIQGLTVYTYNKKAVWVNGGILHIIDGTAPLSGQQVENIAASM